jgi:tetratricopeptide (TPR) repeat protein
MRVYPLWELRRAQGRLDEARSVLEAFLEGPGELDPAWWRTASIPLRASLAVVCAESGHADTARAIYEELARDDFAGLARNDDWLYTMATGGLVAAELGDSRRAGLLYEQLIPHEPLYIFFASGPVSSYLGALAAATSRWEVAQSHLEHAIAASSKAGALPDLARAHLELGRLRLHRNGPGDEAGIENVTAALDLAERLGMRWVAEKARALAPSPTTEADLHAAAPDEKAMTRAVLRRDGEAWAVGFRGRSFRLADSKGLGHLAQLLARPSERFRALDLVGEPDAETDPRRAERARLLVTKRIGSVLRKIEQHSPELGRHLRAGVSTGAWCSYEPEPGAPITWEL